MVATERIESPPAETMTQGPWPETREIMQYKAKYAQKKLKAQDLVGWVKKNGVCKAEKFSYNYAAAADVIAAARVALQEAGLAFVVRNPAVRREVLKPSLRCKGQYGEYDTPATYLYTLEVDMGFIDSETGYEEITRCTGEGSDTGDKGIPKANTNTLKYFLVQNLLIPTGDDPERDPSPQEGEPQTQPPKAPTQAPPPDPNQDGDYHEDEQPIEDQIVEGLLGKQPDDIESDNALPPYNEKSKKIMDGLFDYYKVKIADMEGFAFNALKLRALVFAIKNKWPETAVGATTIKSKITPQQVADRVTE